MNLRLGTSIGIAGLPAQSDLIEGGARGGDDPEPLVVELDLPSAPVRRHSDGSDDPS